MSRLSLRHLRWPIDEIMGILDDRTGRPPIREFPKLKQKPWTGNLAEDWSGELWPDGYVLRNVGGLMTRKAIEQYVENQKRV